MKADTFFSDAEKERITAAIRDTESRTSGEIAVMIVDRSDTYPEARLLLSLLSGAVAALLAVDLFLNDSLWAFIPITAAITALCLLMLRDNTPSLLRMLVSSTRMDLLVQERAIKAFYEKGLQKTRDKTGVLFFLSLFEHKVWVLADEGIYAKISQEELQQFAVEIARSIKQKQAAETLCTEIRRAGDILNHHFPIRPDDINELRDEVIT